MATAGARGVRAQQQIARKSTNNDIVSTDDWDKLSVEDIDGWDAQGPPTPLLGEDPNLAAEHSFLAACLKPHARPCLQTPSATPFT